MTATSKAPHFRRATGSDLPLLDAIRLLAFAPIFASFRSLLGEELYALVQARDDEAQKDLLVSLLEPGSPWEVHVAVVDGETVGFVALRASAETRVGEIGLNAVHPQHAGKGVGTAMYELAVSRMKELGMKAATVSTGGDGSHAAARRAYEKAGFAAQIPSVWFCRTL
jgi:ribosomal protein S18 acetylase RimI-like enzyme